MLVEDTVKPEDLVGEVIADSETTTEPTEDSGIQKKEPEEVSIEDIMSGEPVTDIQKGKAGTPKGVQKRIDELTARAKAAEEKIKQLELEKNAPKNEPLAPDRDEFDTSEDYRKAMSAYQNDMYAYNQAKQNSETKVQEAQRRESENAQRYMSQAEELRTRFPDVDDVIESTHYGNARDYIADSEHSVRIGYYLAKNPAELERIARLTEPSVINREIGKLEAKFENINRNTTKAPPPLNTIKGETVVSKKDPKDMNDSEWYEWHKAEKMRKLKGA